LSSICSVTADTRFMTVLAAPPAADLMATKALRTF